MSFQIEIIKFDQEEHYESVNDLIEYIPEDAEFEQYEYIELEEPEEVVPTALDDELKITFEKIKNESEVVESVFKAGDTSYFIKLETDLSYQSRKELTFNCSNRKCKKEKIGFETQNDLDQHNLAHLKQLSVNECSICNKILANQKKLNFHMHARHIPKNFICDNCGKIFRSKDNLRLHMSHHRKHFVVECRACKKTYKSMQSLRYHLRQHFEHHQCETCGTVS